LSDEVVFGPKNQAKEIYGFNKCPGHERIGVPASVEIIGRRDLVQHGFRHCAALREIAFAPDGRLRELRAFSKCPNLETVADPPSGNLAVVESFSATQIAG
jgi:hypothetical protein